MQLPLELMTQMASAGSPLMAAPASGASDAEAMAEAGQFGELLNQALVAQATPPAQNAPAPGTSLLALLQNNLAPSPEAPTEVAATGEAPAQTGSGEIPGSLNWLALATPPATPDLPQHSTILAPVAPGPAGTQAPAAPTTQAVAPENPAAPKTEPLPQQLPIPPETPVAQGSDAPDTLTAEAPKPRPAEQPMPDEHRSEPDTKAALASQPAVVVPTPGEAGQAEDTPPANDPAPHKQKAPDAAAQEAPLPQAPAASPPGPVALPVSAVELQVRAQIAVPLPPEKPVPAHAVGTQPEAVALPLPATPSIPAAPPAQTLAVQPAFQQNLQGALHPESQGKASPGTQPAANEASGMPAPAETDSLPLPPPPMMETPARGETPSRTELPLAVSIAQAAPVEEASQPTQSPHGLALDAAVHETGEPPRHPHATEPQPLHEPATLPADMPVDVTALDMGPAPDASSASQAALPAVGAPNQTPAADASGKAAPPSTPLFHPRAEALGDQVVEGTAYSVKNGHKELTIRLNPDNLGEVRVNLVSRNVGGTTELSARLIASNPESHEVLQQQLHQLKDSLEAQGVRIERLSVVMATAADTRNETRGGGDFGQQFSQPQQQNTAQQGGQHAGQFGQETPGGFNLGQPGQGPAGQSPQAAPRTHYASAPNQAADLAETIQRPEATLNENGRISVLA